LTVRLSSGISATILDFGPPQKHVLTACLWEAGRKSGGEVGTYPKEIKAGARNRAGCDGKKPGQETRK
jgi:hypothetical protein